MCQIHVHSFDEAQSPPRGSCAVQTMPRYFARCCLRLIVHSRKSDLSCHWAELDYMYCPILTWPFCEGSRVPNASASRVDRPSASDRPLLTVPPYTRWSETQRSCMHGLTIQELLHHVYGHISVREYARKADGVFSNMSTPLYGYEVDEKIGSSHPTSEFGAI